MTVATVLVVDDRATSREIARATLDRAGHHVVEALDGAQALQLARESRPDVVVADVLMPGMDGYEFVHQLRADPDTAGIPVLFYTANYRENEARAIADACGVRRVVLKTADPEVLVRTVEELIAEPALSRPAPRGEAGAWEHLRTVNAKLVEALGNAHLVLDGERDALHLRAVTQRRVVQLYVHWGLPPERPRGMERTNCRADRCIRHQSAAPTRRGRGAGRPPG